MPTKRHFKINEFYQTYLLTCDCKVKFVSGLNITGLFKPALEQFIKFVEKSFFKYIFEGKHCYKNDELLCKLFCILLCYKSKRKTILLSNLC